MFRTILTATGLTLMTALPAMAEGGDRTPAGGAFMSSYAEGPYRRDPRYPAQDGPSNFGWGTTPGVTGSIRAEPTPRRPKR